MVIITSDAENVYNIECGELGQKLNNTLPCCIRECAKQGLNIVCPTIITSIKLMNLYKDILKDFDTTFIYINCDKNEIQNREINRLYRIIGTSLNLLDKFETKEMHDIIIDSTVNKTKVGDGNS